MAYTDLHDMIPDKALNVLLNRLEDVSQDFNRYMNCMDNTEVLQLKGGYYVDWFNRVATLYDTVEDIQMFLYYARKNPTSWTSLKHSFKDVTYGSTLSQLIY